MNDPQQTHPLCYNRRSFLKLTGTGAAALTLGASFACRSSIKERLPNIVIILTDDQGYADAGCYGATGFPTPNLDRMADEGMRFTDFYVAASVCTPSRAALLTGCYPQRVGLPDVLAPSGPAWTTGRNNIGLNSEETTIAEMLRPLGYKTACFGKWHLGHKPPFLPTRHGFDTYFGLPYSNDMRPENDASYPPLPLMENEKVVAYNPDQSHLTTWYTEHALQFIEKNRNHPFFLYLPHTMPHIPLHVSEPFRGKSVNGLYGDVMMEIDWSVGEVLKKLKQLNLDENTLVIFASDNGPWLEYGNHSGSALPLREGKMTTFDGGQRVPCIMRWPGTIPPGVTSHELATAMDLLPTIASLTGAKLPSVRIDGKNIRPLLENRPDAVSPHEAIYFYYGNDLQAVRSGPWKLHFSHPYLTPVKTGRDGAPGITENRMQKPALYHLESDIGEKHNVAFRHPGVVERLTRLARDFDADLKANIRPCGRTQP